MRPMSLDNSLPLDNSLSLDNSVSLDNSLCLEDFMAYSGGPRTYPSSLSPSRPPLAESDQFAAEGEYLKQYIVAEQALLETTKLPLSTQNQVPKAAGVYLIDYDDVLVYIGSTHDLRGRLQNHRTSVQQASRLDLGRAVYRYIIIGMHAATAPESCLTAHYEPEWNTLGFGNHATGKGRKGQARSPWDIRFGRER